MALLCYNKGCGQRFDPEKNTRDSCLYHPGFPIFHDALKGWSCCKKRTTDFSEFLSIKGCTKGYHSNEKPPEPEEASAERKVKVCTEMIVQGPKSAEKMKQERPSPDEPKQLLPLKVSGSLEQALRRLDLSSNKQPSAHGSAGPDLEARLGTTCKNSGCKAVYQGEESSAEVCTFHPGVPVFHEGMKYWSCCGIKTTDFTAFLEQKGCSRGRHIWLKKEDKKLVSCRQDWHQTSSQVVVTIYAKTPLPAPSSVKANRTGELLARQGTLLCLLFQLEIQVLFEGDKVFKAELDLWGVISLEKSFVNLLPSKVEICLQKDGPVTWARLEHSPQSRAQAAQPLEAQAVEAQEAGGGPPLEESDDSLSWSEEEEEEWEEGGESRALPSLCSDGP